MLLSKKENNVIILQKITLNFFIIVDVQIFEMLVRFRLRFKSITTKPWRQKLSFCFAYFTPLFHLQFCNPDAGWYPCYTTAFL